MTEAELLKLIEDGENIRVEFKKSTTEITKDVYDTVCSFSNRDGGIILLGVKDNGEILGVAPDAVDRMKKDFVTSINNGQKINPPLYLQPEACTVDGRTLLVIQVPSGSQVCRHHGRIFDRSHEADIDITDNSDMVYQLYARKSGSYFVNKVTRFQIKGNIFPIFLILNGFKDESRMGRRSRTEVDRNSMKAESPINFLVLISSPDACGGGGGNQIFQSLFSEKFPACTVDKLKDFPFGIPESNDDPVQFDFSGKVQVERDDDFLQGGDSRSRRLDKPQFNRRRRRIPPAQSNPVLFGIHGGEVFCFHPFQTGSSAPFDLKNGPIEGQEFRCGKSSRCQSCKKGDSKEGKHCLLHFCYSSFLPLTTSAVTPSA